MTTDEMRDAIQTYYVATLRASGHSGALIPLPVGITPLGWFRALPESTERLTSDEFNAAMVGEGLAQTGLLEGMTHFAPLEVQDRLAASVKSSGVGGIRRRERAFIVRATGWKA